MKYNKKKASGDTVEPDNKSICNYIPKKKQLNIQTRVEKGKALDKNQREQRAMTRDRWLVQIPKTIIEGQGEDDKNATSIAEQYEEWRES